MPIFGVFDAVGKVGVNVTDAVGEDRAPGRQCAAFAVTTCGEGDSIHVVNGHVRTIVTANSPGAFGEQNSGEHDDPAHDLNWREDLAESEPGNQDGEQGLGHADDRRL